MKSTHLLSFTIAMHASTSLFSIAKSKQLFPDWSLAWILALLFNNKSIQFTCPYVDAWCNGVVRFLSHASINAPFLSKILIICENPFFAAWHNGVIQRQSVQEMLAPRLIRICTVRLKLKETEKHIWNM